MEPININVTKLRTETRDLMERVKYKGERFVVETFGRPMAVIVSLEDYQHLEESLLGAQRAAAHCELEEAPPCHISQPNSKARSK